MFSIVSFKRFTVIVPQLLSHCQKLSHKHRSVKTLDSLSTVILCIQICQKLVSLSTALSHTQVCQNTCIPDSSSLIYSITSNKHPGLEKTIVSLSVTLSCIQLCQNICLPVSSSFMHSSLSKYLSPCHLSYIISVKTLVSLSATLS